jgi:hypothetical protein
MNDILPVDSPPLQQGVARKQLSIFFDDSGRVLSDIRKIAT